MHDKATGYNDPNKIWFYKRWTVFWNMIDLSKMSDYLDIMFWTNLWAHSNTILGAKLLVWTNIVLYKHNILHNRMCCSNTIFIQNIWIFSNAILWKISNCLNVIFWIKLCCSNTIFWSNPLIGWTQYFGQKLLFHSNATLGMELGTIYTQYWEQIFWTIQTWYFE